MEIIPRGVEGILCCRGNGGNLPTAGRPPRIHLCGSLIERKRAGINAEQGFVCLDRVALAVKQRDGIGHLVLLGQVIYPELQGGVDDGIREGDGLHVSSLLANGGKHGSTELEASAGLGRTEDLVHGVMHGRLRVPDVQKIAHSLSPRDGDGRGLHFPRKMNGDLIQIDTVLRGQRGYVCGDLGIDAGYAENTVF